MKINKKRRSSIDLDIPNTRVASSGYIIEIKNSFVLLKSSSKRENRIETLKPYVQKIQKW